ncbi:hypothetical protein OAA09_01380 [bacterium]|nr:hypothetical protein [bacterium]
MQVGDLIYDSHYGQHGLIIEMAGKSNNTSFVTIMFEDGQIDNSMRINDPEVEVVNEDR